ncbi:MAG: amidohydrolase family protein, partial [Bacteroidetes bacterium]|nr:amidohydrolase family protein [Bacteroidota bacterium]
MGYTLFLMVIVAFSGAAGRASGSTPYISAPTDTLYSIIISGGLVYDGLGNLPSRTDVGVIGDRIVRLGDLSEALAERRIEAAGLAVVPGMIDIHSHVTSETIESSAIVQRPIAENYLRQGVTTAIGGQDGSSTLAVGEFLAFLDQSPAAINVGLFIGHGSVRESILGLDDRAPTKNELAEMRALVEVAMSEGAFGLSSGLEYTPGAFARVEEIIEIARAAARYGGLYISHIRDEGAHLLDSVHEVIRVGDEAGLAAQVTHHKVIGKGRWGMTAQSLRLIEDARSRGVDVMSDQYPYTASSTDLTILVPGWAKEGGRLIERLADPDTRSRIRQDVISHINAERGGDPETIVVARCPKREEMDGLSLADILERRGLEINVPAAADVALELIEGGGCSGVFHSMSEEDVRRVMQHPFTMIASDGGVPDPGRGVPHPRNYGTFARVLGRYVRQWHVLSFEEAVRKMTSLPADRLGLSDRGR